MMVVFFTVGHTIWYGTEMNNDLNIVIENEHCRKDMLHLFFETDDLITFLPAETTLADIGVLLGLFPSKGQARKNGWNGEIENGWTEKLGVGKLKKNLWIWKPIKCTIDEI